MKRIFTVFPSHPQVVTVVVTVSIILVAARSKFNFQLLVAYVE